MGSANEESPERQHRQDPGSQGPRCAHLSGTVPKDLTAPISRWPNGISVWTSPRVSCPKNFEAQKGDVFIVAGGNPLIFPARCRAT